MPHVATQIISTSQDGWGTSRGTGANMGRGLHLLSARKVATLKSPGRYADGGGLYLLVRQRSNTLEQLWIYRYRQGPRGAVKEHTISLGPLHAITLADARKRADICRSAVANGEDPRIALLGDSDVPTFGEVADAYVAAITPGFKSTKHAAQWKSTLGDRYCEDLRAIPIDGVTTEHVLAVLQPIWTTKAETANRIRGRIEKVLDSARVQKLRAGENPARWRGHLDHLLPKPPALSRGHHRALPWADAPEFMARLRELESISALALEWTILNATRTTETLLCRPSEINADTKVWTIPKARMKIKTRDHRVPLSDRAMEIYKEALKLDSPFLFPGQSLKDPLSDAAMSECLKGFEVDATVHGFRSTFRDWVAEATSFPDWLAEAALAHASGTKTERAYKRGDVLDRRRELMSAWALYVAKQTDNVVAITGR